MTDEVLAVIDARRADGYETYADQHGISRAMIQMLDDINFLRSFPPTGLRAAIIKHRDQKADDRCWLDDVELYSVLGDGVEPDNHVGDKSLMMANCYRFIEKRCEGGGWTSYIDLEKELNEAHSLLDELGVAGWAYIRPSLSGKLLLPETRSVSQRIKLLIADYRSVECSNCKRTRVQSDGVCEKCLWDNDGNNWASITRPTEYDSSGPIYVRPDENLPNLTGGKS